MPQYGRNGPPVHSRSSYASIMNAYTLTTQNTQLSILLTTGLSNLKSIAVQTKGAKILEIAFLNPKVKADALILLLPHVPSLIEVFPSSYWHPLRK